MTRTPFGAESSHGAQHLPDVAAEAGGAPVKYRARVVEIGPMVADLLEGGILILFGQQAPPELREIAIIHDGERLLAPLAPSDTLVLGGATYEVTAVGAMANGNLAELGHVVIKATGASTTELPGEVYVAEAPLIIPTVGADLYVFGGSAVPIAVPIEEPITQTPAQVSSSSVDSTQPHQPLQPRQSQQRRASWGFLNAWLNSRRRGNRSD